MLDNKLIASEVASTLLRATITAAISTALFLSTLAFVPMLVGWQPVIITSGSMEPWLRSGDIVVVDPSVRKDALPSNAVVSYERHGELITHRVVARNDDGTYATKGDANRQRDAQPVIADQVHARVKFVVPLLGSAALLMRETSGQVGLAIAAGMFAAHLGVGRVVTAVKRTRQLPMPRRTQSRAQRRFVNWALAVAMPLWLVASLLFAGQVVTSKAAYFDTTGVAGNDFTAAEGYFSTVIASAPVSYWRFNEASGPTAVDQMGVQNGTYTASAAFGQPTPLTHDGGNALSCPVGNSCMSMPDNAAHKLTGAHTVAIWIKPAVTQQTTFARVMTKYDGSNLTYFLAFDNSGPGSSGLKMRYLVDVNSRVEVKTTTSITNTSQWYFIVGTWDGSTARVYLNGTQEAAANGVGVVKQNNSGIAFMTTLSSNGARGVIDDAAVWNRALTAGEIVTLYNRATT